MTPASPSLAQVMRSRLHQALPADSLRARLAQGAFWSLVGALLSQTLSLLGSMITARLLGTAGFGELGIILNTVGMFGVFAGLGLSMTATKHVSEFRRSQPDRAGRIIALSSLVAVGSGGLMSVVLLGLAPFLARNTLNAPQLAPMLQLGCGLLFLGAVTGAQTGALAGFEAFKTIALINIIRGLASFPLLVAGVYFWRLPGAVGAQVAALAVGWLLSHGALRREVRRAGVPLSWRLRAEEWPVLYRFSLPATLTAAMTGPVLWASRALLVNEPAGYVQMGFFNAANQWSVFLMFLPSLLMQVLLPIMSSSLGHNLEGDGSRRLLELSQSLMILIVFPIAILMMFFSPYLMAAYGRDFTAAQSVLIGAICNSMIISMGAAVGSFLQACGRMWLGFGVNLLYSAGLLLLAWLLVHRYGANALAFGSAASYALSILFVFPYLSPILPAGMTARVLLGLGFVLGVTAFRLAVPSPPLWAAIPAAGLCAWITYRGLTSPEFRATLEGFLREFVGAARVEPAP